MSFPTPYTVGHHVKNQDAAADRFRAPVTYTPPRDEPGTPVAVIQIAAPESADRWQLGHDGAVVEIELYVPPGFNPGRGDLIDIPDMGQFEVAAVAKDYNRGFHGWQPGNVIPLRRVVG